MLQRRSSVSIRFVLLGLLLITGCDFSATDRQFQQYSEASPATAPPKRVTRLFWKDRQDATIKWSDLILDGASWKLEPKAIAGFPQVSPEKQNLVQMEQQEGILLVGVRDQEDGQYESGWVAVDTGVRGESHGDHMDWDYRSDPLVVRAVLDQDQGNPAHLYLYNNKFYLANDQKNGFSQIDPLALRENSAESAVRFFSGGGQHITLAAVENRVAYSTWIDGGGPNSGRVDVVDLTADQPQPPSYALKLPTGGLHGATENSGRVFFAPRDGVCWIDADLERNAKPDDIQIHHLSLGKDPESDAPLRTGAFENHRNWVLFTTGDTDNSALCLIDASADDPKVTKLKIDVADGLHLVTPRSVLSVSGKQYAFIFQDKKDGDLEEKVTVVDLDPNGDRDFTDAEVAKTIPVGASQVEGHYGHHDICFTPDGRYACVSNPGDGTIWMLSLTDLTIIGQIGVGGLPTSLLAVGGELHHH